MNAREIMTEHPVCCTPDDTAERAARLMQEVDCGVLPVVADRESMRLVGVVTDRDLAVRGLARGKGPKTKVRDLMTANPQHCAPTADVREVERVMAEWQVRRVPIVDERECVIGVVAQADLARAAERKTAVSEGDVARVVERISDPARAAGGRQPQLWETAEPMD
ncbi:MAG TPA: CBS domain-containing protein [Gemmatimonadaceae bacterium]|nr:CBS domain-containing protein [Gemmatimonadaceae bacterium]